MADVFGGTSPPLFSVSDFPPLRRLKPLPKRRRTSDAGSQDEGSNDDQTYATAPESNSVDASVVTDFPLPSYYYPHFSATQPPYDPYKNPPESRPPGSLDLHTAYRTIVTASDHDDHHEGDYVDHPHHPGNTKKRKVPVNQAHALPGGLTEDIMGGEDTAGYAYHTDGGPPQTDDGFGVQAGPVDTGPAPLPISVPRKFKAGLATMTGLKHKEMLQSRKRQVASVLGVVPLGSSLALDQALSSNLPWVRTAFGTRPPRQRPPPFLSDQKTSVGIPKVPFTYTCPSPTVARLIATREEVVTLQERFSVELLRQATAAAEAAAHAASAHNSVPKGGKLRGGQRKRPVPAIDGSNAYLTPSFDSTALGPTKSKNPKKKKRSALANASNPHHLRNYVPSRIPNSGPPAHVTAAQVAQNFLGPPPTKFLLADLRSGGQIPSVDPPPIMPDEWICSFCEYDLFYSQDANFRRAVRSRKKILRRRRRARERAARTASGIAPVAPSSTETDEEDEEYDTGVGGYEERGQSRRREREFEDRGGGGGQGDG